MSIYKPSPVSSAVGGLSSLGGSLLGGLGQGLGQGVAGLLGDSALGKFGSQVAGAAIGMATNEASKRISSAAQTWASGVDQKLEDGARDVLGGLGLNIFGNQSANRDALLFAGGLSLSDMKHIIDEVQADTLSRKNFYVLQINDRSGRGPVEGADGNRSLFNLFTTQLSVNAFDIGGETVQIGSGELDVINTSARSELNLTVMDTADGIIKEWATRKASYTTPSNGTVMPPYYYLFDVRIVYGTNIAYKQFYDQVYTMRVAGMQNDLGRSEQGLEEVPLRFVQSDTFMPHWL